MLFRSPVGTLLYDGHKHRFEDSRLMESLGCTSRCNAAGIVLQSYSAAGALDLTVAGSIWRAGNRNNARNDTAVSEPESNSA